jgi:uracil-DNA glycosylase family 4
MSEDSVIPELAAEIRSCVRCPLHSSRKNAVPGEGPSDASVVIVGEAPGRNEDEQGRPFVGAAGQNLDALLSEAGLNRESVFITNSVKCRPPENRRPARSELDACHPYLRRQVEAIAPRVVVLLGDTALKEFFPESTLGRSHGTPMRRSGLEFFPTYHPASVIYNPSLKETLDDDFRKLGALVRGERGGIG